jgi:hypothetical protein
MTVKACFPECKCPCGECSDFRLATEIAALPRPESGLLPMAMAGIAAGEIRVTDPATGGMKGSKPVRFDLIPAQFETQMRRVRENRSDLGMEIRDRFEQFWEGLRSPEALLVVAHMAEGAIGGGVASAWHIATVYGRGAQKYDDNNWHKGYRWSLSYAAALRHLGAIERGEMIDPEMQVPHWACIWWHAATLWTFATEGLGTDDRPKKEAA